MPAYSDGTQNNSRQVDLPELTVSAPPANDQAVTIRLRNVTMPEFFSVTAAGAAANALLPVGVVLADAGVNTSDVRATTVSVPSAASYGIPQSVFPQNWPSTSMGEDMTVEKFAKTQAQTLCRGRRAYIFAISEVLMAYEIDVGMTFDKETSARIKAIYEPGAGTTRAGTLDRLGERAGIPNDSNEIESGAGSGTSNRDAPAAQDDQAESFAEAKTPQNELSEAARKAAGAIPETSKSDEPSKDDKVERDDQAVAEKKKAVRNELAEQAQDYPGYAQSSYSYRARVCKCDENSHVQSCLVIGV